MVPAYDVDASSRAASPASRSSGATTRRTRRSRPAARPLRQRRRTTYVYRAPFQLRLRLEFLDSGAVTTILFLLQPEDADSTRIYTCLLLAAGPGRPLPAPADGGRGGRASSTRILDEDLDLQAATGQHAACRWTCATSCTCAPTGSGVALRQALADFAAVGRRQPDAA